MKGTQYISGAEHKQHLVGISKLFENFEKVIPTHVSLFLAEGAPKNNNQNETL